MPTSSTDRDLVDRVIAGDARAADEFVDRFWRFIRAVVFRELSRGGSRDSGLEDIPQTVILRLWEDDHRRLRAWRGGPDDDFVDYLGPIVRHLCRDKVRRRARRSPRSRGALTGDPRPGLGPDDPVEPGPDAADILLERERHEAALEALHRLRTRDRELLEKRHLGDEPLETIAAELGLTLNALYVALHRAEKRLVDKVRELHPDLFPASVRTDPGPSSGG